MGSERTYGTVTFAPPAGSAGRGSWVLHVQPHLAIRLKRLFPRVMASRTGAIVLSDTAEVCRDLEWVLERWPMDVDPASAAQLAGQAQRHRDAEAAVDRILLGGQRLNGLHSPVVAPRDYQIAAADLALSNGRGLLVVDDVGLGKAQPLDSMVLTPHGFRRMGSLAVGDRVIVPDGSVAQIIGVYPQGEVDSYRVTFTDGSVVECSEDHLWLVSNHRRSRSRVTGDLLPRYWSTKTVGDLLEGGLRNPSRSPRAPYGQAKWHVPMVTAAELECGLPRPLDPYVLGVLLGDGGLTHGTPQLTNVDQELVSEVARLVPAGIVLKRSGTQSYRLVDTAKPVRTCAGEDECASSVVARGLCASHYEKAVRRNRHQGTPLPPVMGRRPNRVTEALRDLGVFGHTSLTKSVPDAYKVAPVAVRLAVLQGLMDADGSAFSNGTHSCWAQFYTSSPQLSRDAAWLVQSLGGTAKVSIKHVQGRDRFTLSVNLPPPLVPFRLSRKAQPIQERQRDNLRGLPTRAIAKIEPAGRKPMQCIAVDHPSRLYVTDAFVVTHNTFTSLCVLRDPRALPALVVTLTHLPSQWLNEMTRWFPWLVGHVVTSGRPYDVAARAGVEPNVLVMNYAKVAGWADHLAGRVRTVIFDEVQELRRPESQKHQAAGRIADGADFKVGLSATPIYNYGGEVHSIFNVLAPDVLGARDEFAREWGIGTDRKMAVSDPAALSAYLKDMGVMLRRTRKDVGRELPDLQRVVYPVDLDEQVLSGLEDEALGLAQMIVAAEGSTQERWRAAGDLDWRLRHATGVAKAPFVADFVKLLLESEQRVVLFGWHRQVYDIWEERLAAFRPAFYTGSESTTQKARSADSFIAGDSRVLIMSLRSGLGLDGLQQVASVAVLGELDWSPGVHDQCFGRLHRDGQTQPVVAYIPLAESGSDPVMAEVNGVKAMQADGFVDPDAEPFEEATNSHERIRMLAFDVLRRRGITAGAAAHLEAKAS